MSREGLWWYTDPGVIGQKFSAVAKSLPGEIGEAVSEAIDKAAQSMRQTVMTSGVKDHQRTGDGRIRTGAMFNSIDAEVEQGGGGRVRGNFGFIDDAPSYTQYQEYGTRGGRAGSNAGGSGIMAMLAFAKAQNDIRNDLAESVSKIDWWKNFR
jgi:hypothetical protein